MKRIEQLCPSLLSYSPPIWAASLVGVLVISTLFLSMLLLFQHLSSYKNPEEQKFLIGVILMVPFYAIESLSDVFVRSFGLSGQVDYISFSIPRLYQNYHNYTAIFYMYVSLVDPSISIDCAILRDCYEAFAMYCFGRYLVACLGGEEKTIEFLNRQGTLSSTAPLLGNAAEKGVMKHPFPMNYFLKPWRLGEWFYQIIKMGIVQYMIIKTVTAILAVFLEAFGVYCDGEFTWTCGYPYMAVVINFSQSWALYCLVQFYAATKDELAHIKPLAKFLMFKSIVFLTWWQDVAIALLYSWGLFKSPIAQGLQFNSSVQDFIICIEMCGASVVHLFVFPAKPYKLMGDNFLGGVSVLGDYASLDCPLDPNEVKDSERPTKLRLPQPDVAKKGKTPIRESVRDVVLGGGEYIVNDLKFTMTHAVEPMEKGLTKFNKKLQKISQHIRKHDGKFRTKDDSCIGSSSPSRRVVRGIDDPLLNPSFSDSGAKSSGKYRRKSGYASAESGGDGSDPPHGRFEIHGCRWITKD